MIVIDRSSIYSVATALAKLLLGMVRLDGEGRSANAGLIGALVEADDLLGESFEEFVDVVAGLGAGFHEGHLVLVG